jgi:hypothetical protein
LGRSPETAGASTTLVVFPGALGDLVCFLPTLCALYERSCPRGRRGGLELPRRGRLVIVAQSALLPLAVRPGLADHGVAIERAAVASLFVSGGAASRTLLGAGRVRDVFSWFASDERIVRDNLGAQADGRVVCAPFRVPEAWERHAADHFLVGGGLDVLSVARATRLPLLQEEEDCAAVFWRRYEMDGRPVLALHRGAGAHAKRWDDAGFATVASWWRGRGGRVLEIAGPADPLDVLNPTHVLARDLGVGDVAGLLARVSLFVGTDSGVSHLAGAVGARGVVIFGPTRARTWRPRGGRLVALTRGAAGDQPGAPTAASVSSARVVRALSILAATCDFRRAASS